MKIFWSQRHISALLTPRRLVITGGEPLLQQSVLEELVAELSEFLIEVETNGTIVPSGPMRSRVTQWNVSPKLSNSGMRTIQRLNTDALTVLRDTERAWLKLVVVDLDDMIEISRLVATTNWPKEKVILMPEATSPTQLAERSNRVAEAAMQYGFRFSTRLQVLLWDNARGR